MFFHSRSKSTLDKEKVQARTTDKKGLSSKALAEALKRKIGTSVRNRESSASESESEDLPLRPKSIKQPSKPGKNSDQSPKIVSASSQRSKSSKSSTPKPSHSRRKSRQDDDDSDGPKKSSKAKKKRKDSESDFEPTPKPKSTPKPKRSDSDDLPQHKITRPTSSKPPGSSLFSCR